MWFERKILNKAYFMEVNNTGYTHILPNSQLSLWGLLRILLNSCRTEYLIKTGIKSHCWNKSFLFESQIDKVCKALAVTKLDILNTRYCYLSSYKSLVIILSNCEGIGLTVTWWYRVTSMTPSHLVLGSLQQKWGTAKNPVTHKKYLLTVNQ